MTKKLQYLIIGSIILFILYLTVFFLIQSNITTDNTIIIKTNNLDINEKIKIIQEYTNSNNLLYEKDKMINDQKKILFSEKGESHINLDIGDKPYIIADYIDSREYFSIKIEVISYNEKTKTYMIKTQVITPFQSISKEIFHTSYIQ